MAKRSKCMLTFALKRLRLYVKGKHSTAKGFQRETAVGKKTITITVLLESWYINNKSVQGIRIPGRPYSFMR